MIKKKEQKGITLIALIITIIVLLILAVVAISAVQNDGIIGYAKNAREEYEKAGDNEKTTLGEYLSKIEANLPENAGTGTGTSTPGAGNNGGGDLNSAKEVTKGVKVTGSNGIYTEKVGEKTLKATIPVGFCVVNDIEGDTNTIESGLVISDVADDDLNNSKKGNQFVWIPVEDYSKFHLIEGYAHGSLDSMLTKTNNPSIEAGDSANVGSPMANNNVAGTAESIAMYKSVKDNKGFYMARFEAGNPGTESIDGTVKPLSQKGIDAWSTIPWGGTRSDTASDGLPGNDNADGAVKVARSMYTKSNECGVTSTLCYGVQWDAAMNFIDSNYYKQDGSLTSFVANSYKKGRYSSDLPALTGSKRTYQQNHIFDLAGNVLEWTMEGCRTEARVMRGGYYWLDGSDVPASFRVGTYPEGRGEDTYGFRVALYL